MSRLFPPLLFLLLASLLAPAGVGGRDVSGAPEPPPAFQPTWQLQGEHQIKINFPGCGCGLGNGDRSAATAQMTIDGTKFTIRRVGDDTYVSLEGHMSITGSSGTMSFKSMRVSSRNPPAQAFEKEISVLVEDGQGYYLGKNNKRVLVGVTKIHDKANTLGICLPRKPSERLPDCDFGPARKPRTR
jgi:hypothetical protein